VCVCVCVCVCEGGEDPLTHLCAQVVREKYSSSRGSCARVVSACVCGQARAYITTATSSLTWSTTLRPKPPRSSRRACVERSTSLGAHMGTHRMRSRTAGGAAGGAAERGPLAGAAGRAPRRGAVSSLLAPPAARPPPLPRRCERELHALIVHVCGQGGGRAVLPVAVQSPHAPPARLPLLLPRGGGGERHVEGEPAVDDAAGVGHWHEGAVREEGVRRVQHRHGGGGRPPRRRRPAGASR